MPGGLLGELDQLWSLGVSARHVIKPLEMPHAPLSIARLINCFIFSSSSRLGSRSALPMTLDAPSRAAPGEYVGAGPMHIDRREILAGVDHAETAVAGDDGGDALRDVIPSSAASPAR